MKSVDDVADAVGLQRATMRDLAARVKTNHGRLAACQGHRFGLSNEGPGGGLGQTFTCTRCGGEIDGHAHFWYSRGREDGLRSGAGAVERVG